MAKVLLTGNGVTSQIITGYKDCNMIKQFRTNNEEVYIKINNLFEPFRINKHVKYSDEFINNHTMATLDKINIGNREKVFDKYFIEYGLIHEILNKEIIGIEILLKVAEMFNMSRAEYDKVKKIADIIYYNDGNNGIKHVDTTININKFSEFINSFDYVYTTNYDNLLDDVYNKEVYHLHGGFNYIKELKSNGEVHKIKTDKIVSPNEAYLIWGINSDEKEKQTLGGFSFPMSFPITLSGKSILSEYYNKLKSDDIKEIHIWGYSGMNDGHINKCISANKSIKKIYVYCNPNKELKNNKYKQEVKKRYIGNLNLEKQLILKSWNDVWEKFMCLL